MEAGYCRVCSCSKMLPKFKMATRGQLQNFLSAQKFENLKVRIYSNFTITFPMIWRCAGDFFKILPYKMAATDQLKKSVLSIFFLKYTNHIVIPNFLLECVFFYLMVKRLPRSYFKATILRLLCLMYDDILYIYPRGSICSVSRGEMLHNFGQLLIKIETDLRNMLVFYDRKST